MTDRQQGKAREIHIPDLLARIMMIANKMSFHDAGILADVELCIESLRTELAEKDAEIEQLNKRIDRMWCAMCGSIRSPKCECEE